MASISVNVFEPVVGKAAEAVGLVKEAQEILTGLGNKVQVAQLVRGGVPGQLSVIVETADAAAYGASLDKLNADVGFQSFMLRATAAAAAVPVRSVDYAELPGLEANFDDLAGSRVIMASLFIIREGQLERSVERIERWKSISEKHGAKCRALQSIASDPAFVTATIGYYENFTEWGRIGQALGTDPDWQAFAGEIRGADASADFLRTSLMQII